MKKANKTEEAIANDESEMRSITTGEVLKEKGLCPLVIVRSSTAGVHIGYLARFNETARTAELLEARCLWRWRGANSMKEVATHGVENEYTRITEAVPQSVIMGIDEVVPVAEKASKNLTTSRWGA